MEPTKEAESNCGGDGSQVLRVHRRFATHGMCKLFKAVDKHRAASLGEFRQLDRPSLAVSPRCQRPPQRGLQPRDDHGTTSRQ